MSKQSKTQGQAPAGAQRADAQSGSETEDKTQEATASGAAPKAEEKAPTETKSPDKPPYAVAPGKAVTTAKRGLREEGQEVTAEDFGGRALRNETSEQRQDRLQRGQARLDELARKGVVVKS